MGGTLHERIASARRTLAAAGIEDADAALDADVLARHVLGWDRAALLVHGGDPAPPEFVERYEALITRRAGREPVAYITGVREFWERDFEVTPDVLIPRPESELIVETVLGLVDRSRAVRILDVGTGSGCLAVSLAAELPRARVVATDVSTAALRVARRNAERHGVAGRIAWLRGDLLDPVAGPLDIVVSNPPYVVSGETLAPEVGRHEPAGALYAGADGLAALRRLIPAAGPVLAPDGVFVVEFGFGQADAVRSLAESAGWASVELRSDLQGILRVAVMS